MVLKLSMAMFMAILEFWFTVSVSTSAVRPRKPIFWDCTSGIEVIQLRCSSLCENNPTGRKLFQLLLFVSGFTRLPTLQTNVRLPAL